MENKEMRSKTRSKVEREAKIKVNKWKLKKSNNKNVHLEEIQLNAEE